MAERKFIQQAYARVCRDSHFKLNATDAAQFTGKLVGVHPLEVLSAIGDLDNMTRIASGDHPIHYREDAA